MNRDELDDFNAYNRLSSPCEDEDDDLQRYLAEKPVRFMLKHLAFTYLAAPSSTATNERLFSIAGNVVNEERPRIQARATAHLTTPTTSSTRARARLDLTTPTSPRRTRTAASHDSNNLTERAHAHGGISRL
ncbi:hypothetical protein Q7P36_010293 [Cladosporium allicinum]